MRTEFGITLRNAEIIILLKVKITNTVTPIPKALVADLIIASVGQVPKTSINVGF